ncbi:MAG: nucleotidyltransferase domain-containing protein [Patescibacteria group bacterium]|nr:nucleotidyltransferase domain-containing protein [Patescibacteria group bacterium]
MRLEHYPVKRLKKEVLEIVAKHLDISEYRVFFFGSRVSGKGDERSDIDIGIEGKEKIAGKIMADIQEDIDSLPILYKIEIVDFKAILPKFKEVACQSMEIIT